MKRETLHNGCHLHFQVRGTGPAVLLIQGVGVHGDGWAPQVEELSGTFTCITFDNRGMGQSQPAAGRITVPVMADDALAVLDALQIGTVHVVGHSLGGLVALQLALVARQRVASLSLLCTFPSGRHAAPLSWRMAWLGFRSRIGTRRMRRRGFMRLIMPPGPIRDIDDRARQLEPLFGHDLADLPPVAGDQLKALRSCDLTGRLHELNGLPTLIVSAAHDPIAPPPAGRRLRSGIRGANLVEVGDASHGLPITHAGRVNQLLLAHFASASPTAAGGGIAAQ